MTKLAIGGAISVFIVIGILIYVFVLKENRDYKNNIAQENINFVSSNFDGNRAYTTKIEDFDIFKNNGYDVRGPVYTYTNSKSSSNPYGTVVSTNVDQGVSLNSTLLPDDIAVEMVDAALPVSGTDVEDSAPSLTGLNAGTEASIRESMVRGELRRMRR